MAGTNDPGRDRDGGWQPLFPPGHAGQEEAGGPGAARGAPPEAPPPLPHPEIPFQLGLDGEMVDWPAADEASVSILSEGVQLARPAPPEDADAAPTSLRARLAKAAETPRFDAMGYAAYRRHIEEAEVEIIHREGPPKADAKPADLPTRLLRALKGEGGKSQD